MWVNRLFPQCGGAGDLACRRIQGSGPRRGGFEAFAGLVWKHCCNFGRTNPSRPLSSLRIRNSPTATFRDRGEAYGSVEETRRKVAYQFITGSSSGAFELLQNLGRPQGDHAA